MAGRRAATTPNGTANRIAAASANVDMNSWRTRLEQFDRDLEQEPRRIREFYEVRARRVEPVGLVYLWPETS